MIRDQKKIKNIAEKIMQLEHQHDLYPNQQELIEYQLTEIANSLSLEDLFKIDEYIMNHISLNKN